MHVERVSYNPSVFGRIKTLLDHISGLLSSQMLTYAIKDGETGNSLRNNLSVLLISDLFCSSDQVHMANSMHI